MGCCEIKGEIASGYEPEINIVPKEDSFNEMDLSADEMRATTNPNKLSWINTTPLGSSRPRSTSYTYTNRIELAFLINSPLFTKPSEATKSVLVPFSENSMELCVIKEEDKDITVSFEDIKTSK